MPMQRFRFLILAAMMGGAVVACGDDADSDDNGGETDTGIGGDTGGGETCDDPGAGDLPVDGTCWGAEPSGLTPYEPGSDCSAADPSNAIEITPENIGDNLQWTCDNAYLLTGGAPIFVEDILQIEAGTQIYGTTATALVITSTGLLNAQGTAEAPIVFTSASAEGERAAGDWGGIVMLGNAPTNQGSDNIEGMEESALSAFGGNDVAHNCGVLRYARVEFAGYLFGEDNELNGITLGGCGNETLLEYVQVHAGKDDGIEFFGGTANGRYLVISDVQDDSLDMDHGFQGSIQFLAIQQGPDGERGFEADNDGGNIDNDPRSMPYISNVTIIGNGQDDQLGMKLREGFGGVIANVLMTDLPEGAIDIDARDGDDNVVACKAQELLGNDLVFGAMAVGGCADAASCIGSDSSDDDSGLDEVDYFSNVVGMETAVDTGVSAGSWIPAAGGVADNGGPVPNACSFDTSAEYLGAFAPGGDNWAEGWTAFPAN